MLELRPCSNSVLLKETNTFEAAFTALSITSCLLQYFQCVMSYAGVNGEANNFKMELFIFNEIHEGSGGC